ncbi:expressed unknown protein [Seminavis robusta]|uniref:Uncharacterized protein n=1 Tax=Seminavis robusta TaxID=568900 RepID=A0A9N8D9Z6_9STRA|nr:expressed unknown protein [Seminavis robusta]|eukprot:Sro12_g009240.1 n/a (534) ;mRNA; f:51347-52948
MTAFAKRPSRRLSLSDIPDFGAFLSSTAEDDAAPEEKKRNNGKTRPSKAKRNSISEVSTLRGSSSATPSFAPTFMNDSAASFALEDSDLDASWRQEQAEEAARRVRQSKSSRRGQRTTVDVGVEVPVLNPIREKVGRVKKSSSSNNTTTTESQNDVPPRKNSKSKSKTRSSKLRAPAKTEEALMHQSCSVLDVAFSSRSSNEISKLKKKNSNSDDRMSNSDHGPTLRKIMNGINGTKTSSSSRRSSAATPRVRLEPSKRDVAAQKEKGITIAERLSASTHAATTSPGPSLCKPNGTTSTPTTTPGSADQQRRRSRRRRRSMEPPALRTSAANASISSTSATTPTTPRARRKSRSQSRGAKSRSAPSLLLSPGEKLFVPDEETAAAKRTSHHSRGASTVRSKRSSKSANSTATAPAMLLSPGERPFVLDERPSTRHLGINVPTLDVGTSHHQVRRRRRHSTGREALVMALAQTGPLEHNNKNNASNLAVNEQEKALFLLSPDSRSAVWEKRAAMNRIMSLDESKPAIAAPPLAF